MPDRPAVPRRYSESCHGGFHVFQGPIRDGDRCECGATTYPPTDTGRPADPGLDADLATLRLFRERLPLIDEAEYVATLDRVEAGLARLREELASADRVGTSAWSEKVLREREAAEARCAAMEECDCIPFAFSSKACPKCGRRGVVSDKTVSQFLIERNEFEAERARLRQALGELRSALARERGGGTPLSRSEYIELHRSSGELLHRREALAGPDTPADSQWFIPEGDRTCGVVHRLARATCMKRRGHEGSHATPQGTWIDGPWCEYPADCLLSWIEGATPDSLNRHTFSGDPWGPCSNCAHPAHHEIHRTPADRFRGRGHCECETRGLSEQDECIYDDPCLAADSQPEWGDHPSYDEMGQ